MCLLLLKDLPDVAAHFRLLQRILVRLLDDIFTLLCRLKQRMIASAHFAFQVSPEAMHRTRRRTAGIVSQAYC
jgi:hypothetical protein